MRPLSLALAANALVFAQSALAADLPRAVPAKAPAMVVPTATWTGFHAGLNAGYGWGSEAIGISGDPSVLTVAIPNGIVPASIADNPKGFIGGGQIGYNHQFGQWVLGVEADLQWSDIKRSQTVLTAAPGGRERLQRAQPPGFSAVLPDLLRRGLDLRHAGRLGRRRRLRIRLRAQLIGQGRISLLRSRHHLAVHA